MPNISDSTPLAQSSTEPTPIFLQKLVKRCHVILPDVPEPVGAILHEGKLYAYVKFFATLETAQRGAKRLEEKGNQVILTRVAKGLVLWVYESEATLANQSQRI